jgi:hypothetical protein
MVSVMASGTLSADDLWRAALTTHLFEKLARVPRDHPTQELLRSLQNTGDRIHSFPQLSRALCRWVLELLGADLVYLLLYDARVHVFRPTGITISARNARTFLENPDELDGLGWNGDDSRGKTPLDRYQAEEKSDGKHKGLIHALLAQAVVSRLLPRQHRTHDVFHNKKPITHADVLKLDEADRPRDWFFSRYARAIVGVPFPFNALASSDGVLWVCWQEPQEKEFVESVPSRLLYALEVVAAMYAIFRYHAPDRVYDLLYEPDPTSATGRTTR